MRLLKGLSILLLGLVIVTSLALIPVSAKNTETTSFVMSLSGYRTQKTKYRVKEDASSAYMKCTYTSNPSRPCYAKVWAYYERAYNDNLEGDASNGHVYTFYQGQSKKLINYVWEWKPYDTKKAYAALELSVGYYDSLSVTGVWSPDSK